MGVENLKGVLVANKENGVAAGPRQPLAEVSPFRVAATPVPTSVFVRRVFPKRDETVRLVRKDQSQVCVVADDFGQDLSRGGSRSPLASLSTNLLGAASVAGDNEGRPLTAVTASQVISGRIPKRTRLNAAVAPLQPPSQEDLQTSLEAEFRNRRDVGHLRQKAMSFISLEIPGSQAADLDSVLRLEQDAVWARARIAYAPIASLLNMLVVGIIDRSSYVISSKAETLTAKMTSLQLSIGARNITLATMGSEHNTLAQAQRRFDEIVRLPPANAVAKDEFQDMVTAVSTVRSLLSDIYSDRQRYGRYFLTHNGLCRLLKITSKHAKEPNLARGVYAGTMERHLPLCFGMSDTSVHGRLEDKRTKKDGRFLLYNSEQGLENILLPCGAFERIDKLVNLSRLQYHPDYARRKMAVIVSQVLEALYACINPSLTCHALEALTTPLPLRLRAITEPTLDPKDVDAFRQIVDHAGGAGQFNGFWFNTSWATIESSLQTLRGQYGYELVDHHMGPQHEYKFATYLRLRENFGDAFSGFTDCVDKSPRLRDVELAMDRISRLMTGSAIEDFVTHGAVGREFAIGVKGILRELMQRSEYVSATPEELADGFEFKWPLLREKNRTQPLVIDFSVFRAIFSHKRTLHDEVFGGREVHRVLRGRGKSDSHQLTIFFRRDEREQAIVVMHTLYTSHSIDDVGIENRLGALEVSGCVRQLCAASGLRSDDDAQIIQRRDLSFLSYIMGYKDGEQRDIFKPLRMHTPAGLCESAIPEGLRCIVSALNKLVGGKESLGFKSLLALRCYLGRLACSRGLDNEKVLFNLMIAAVGVRNVQAASSLPIEIEPKCSGVPSIGDKPSRECGTPEQTMFCLYDAQTDSLGSFSDHIVCGNCYSKMFKQEQKHLAKVQETLIKLASALLQAEKNFSPSDADIRSALTTAGGSREQLSSRKVFGLIRGMIRGMLQVCNGIPRIGEYPATGCTFSGNDSVQAFETVLNVPEFARIHSSISTITACKKCADRARHRITLTVHEGLVNGGQLDDIKNVVNSLLHHNEDRTASYEIPDELVNTALAQANLVQSEVWFNRRLVRMIKKGVKVCLGVPAGGHLPARECRSTLEFRMTQGWTRGSCSTCHTNRIRHGLH